MTENLQEFNQQRCLDFMKNLIHIRHKQHIDLIARDIAAMVVESTPGQPKVTTDDFFSISMAPANEVVTQPNTQAPYVSEFVEPDSQNLP